MLTSLVYKDLIQINQKKKHLDINRKYNKYKWLINIRIMFNFMNNQINAN